MSGVLSFFRQAVQQVATHYHEQGKAGELAVMLQICLSEDMKDSAAKLGVSEGALRVKVYRFRQRLRAAFSDQVASSCYDPDMVEDEVTYLLKLLFRDGLGVEPQAECV